MNLENPKQLLGGGPPSGNELGGRNQSSAARIAERRLRVRDQRARARDRRAEGEGEIDRSYSRVF